jgi:superfamily II DNA or RNA helicase
VRRWFNKRQKMILALISSGKCQVCGNKLQENFHADHVLPFSKGGKTNTANGQALCPTCNLTKGNKTMTIKLRNWQVQSLNKALVWLLSKDGDRQFIINAAPGAGKTIAACAIAQELISGDEIDRVVVIAPRAEVVNQWSEDFKRVTGRFMSKVTGSDGDIDALGVDVCSTWSAVQGLLDGFQAICCSSRTLVICDEHHHAAVEAAWGSSADSAFAQAKHVLILTGTPIRSDGEKSVWLAYDAVGAMDHPDEGTYTLTYGEAVELGYCRPVTFHKHEGRFTIDLDGGENVEVASHQPADLTKELKRIPGLQSALDFYRLASTPQYEADGSTPLITGYQATMLEWGSKKLDDLRMRMPEAGGLVIAPSIEMAEYMAKLIEMIEGDAPIIVHSQMNNPDARIKAFKNTKKRWVVSVAMISEGVDIKRLRVLVHLPNALTELAFRQAIGRVVRTQGSHDDTRAYVVMPSTEIFEAYARRIENEMSPGKRKDPGTPKTKKCPACHTECDIKATECDCCGYEFPSRGGPQFKACGECGALNPVAATNCHACGISFGTSFSLSLDEALRTGAIVRGMELDEAEVAAGEALATPMRDRILKSGDSTLIRVYRMLPDESLARFLDIASGAKSAERGAS